MANSLPKAYEPKDFEKKWYDYWMSKDFFVAKPERGKPRFSMVIPPPNITGTLHIGHALDTTLQDIFVRYNRMLGKTTLWLPGTDHASIATHAKIEESLAAQGTSRWELGREEFLKRAWDWKEQYGGRIIEQLKTLGASCDWTRQRFTMDEGCSRAVREVFVRLYEKGLIYRNQYLVNYCTNCGTVISDIEVEHEETDGTLYYVKYPLVDSSGLPSETEYIEIATTRPETILGDTGIAVNPGDTRYTDISGRTAVLPVLGRIIPIVEDEFVDPAFGTGAVKITPAHDSDDFQMGITHRLPSISVIGTDGKMTEEAGPYKGLDRYECRKRLLEYLDKEGNLVKKEDYKFSIGRCQRCNSIIEPLISLQWFVKMNPLTQPAIEIVKNGTTSFVPERFTKIYENWMENIRDWCISRQLWWGHRIPAFYCENCGKMVVSREYLTKCPDCSGPMRQDEDVLDTWFSSALWPFSTMGWPEDTEDLKCFFPTDVLVTGYDIIFFWVARMIFSSIEFTGKEPFRHVLIHGLVRDALGRKMSKSLGNGIDPLDIVDKYGADALRISLITGVAMGNDTRFSDEKAESARNFCNKLWNASRYCLGVLEDWSPPPNQNITGQTAGWILTGLDKTKSLVKDAMERFEPGEALGVINEFIWNEFCDWYIEFSKQDLKNPHTAEETKFVLWHVLKESLKLLHPFAPFITEELWSYLPKQQEDIHINIIISQYPTPGTNETYPNAAQTVDLAIEAIKLIRNMRAGVNLPTGKQADITILADDKKTWELLSPYIVSLAWVKNLEIRDRDKASQRPGQALTAVIRGLEIYLPLAGVIDIDKELDRLGKVIDALENEMERTGERLSNKEFLAKAPEKVVQTQKVRYEESKEKLVSLKDRYSVLKLTKSS